MVKRLLFFIALLLLPSVCLSTDWYVRTSSGEYGAEDGTTYATAFDGFSGIVWASISAGDTVYVCGTFTAEYNATGKSGTSGNPITLDGSCPGGSAGDLNANDSGNRGLRVVHSYVTVKNLTIRNFGSQYGINLGGVGSPVTGVTVDNLEVHTGSNVAVVAAGYDITIQNNTVHDILNNGIWIVRPYEGQNCTGVVIDGNTLYDIGVAGQNYDGISASNGSGNITIRNNTITNVLGSNGSGCIDQSTGTGYTAANNVQIYNNYVDGCGYGIAFGDEVVKDTFYVHNNVIVDAAQGLVTRPKVTAYIYNNTLAGSGSTGIWFYAGSTPDRDIWLKNNNVAGTYTDLLSYTTSGLTIISDYNNWCKLPACSSDGISGQESHSLNANPQFVSSTDYHLTSVSTLVNAGTDVGLTTDYDGNSLVGLPDIGAYEYVPPSISGGVYDFQIHIQRD